MKSNVDDLAIFGGAPAFTETLHVGRPNIGSRAALTARINALLDRGWLTNDGPLVREFEKRVAEMVGVRHCVAVCNATVGLEITARALGLRGEVIVPSFTFVATAHALRWQGITPVFCDVTPGTFNIDPREAERLITPRTSAVVGVHVWGRVCDVEALAELCGRRGLKLLFDASHAFGVSHGGRMVGSFGEAEVFSFHATKVLNTFEGGAVVTDDEKLAAEVRLLRNFGFAGFDEVVCLGTNGKMSEVSAAMGLTSLESLSDFIAANRVNYERYRLETANVPGLKIVTYDEGEKSNYHYIVLEVDQAQVGLSRDSLLRILLAENVIARRYFYPGCHRMEPYHSQSPGAASRLGHTEAACECLLQLPNGQSVSESHVREICGILRLAVERAPEVAARLLPAEGQLGAAPARADVLLAGDAA